MADSSSPPVALRNEAAARPITALISPVETVFEEYWNAWRARGVRHEVAVRRRVRIAASVIVLTVGIVTIASRSCGGAL